MFKISKMAQTSASYRMTIRIAAIMLAFLATSIFLAAMNLNPLKVYLELVKGAFGSPRRISETVKFAVPLVIVSIGIMLAFKMNFWNIGADGQMYMGAFCASYFALFHSNLPSYILLPIMALAGIIGGGIWAFIAAIIKVKFGTNETLLTLMLNYIAQLWITYLQSVLWRDPNAKGMNVIARFSDNARLPSLFGVNIGWIIAIVLVIAAFIYLRKTKSGYEISVVGDSPNTARYAGMNVGRIILITVFMSGAICGLAGMVQASGVTRTLTSNFTGGAGFTAIATAWLANLNELAIIPVCLLFAALVQGANSIEITFGIPNAAAQLLQGTILFFVLAGEFFINYKIKFKARG